MHLFKYKYSPHLIIALLIAAAPNLLQAASHEAEEIKAEAQQDAKPAPTTAPAPETRPYNYQRPPMRPMPPMKAIPGMPPMRQIPPMQPMPPMKKMPPIRAIPPYQQRPYTRDYAPRYAPPAYRSYPQPYRDPGYSGQPAPQTKAKQPAAAGAVKSIAISGMQYQPARIEVKVGESVTWTNQDAAPHTVTARDGISFASTTLSQGANFTHTFTKAGSYDYYCTYHPNMRGTVIVK